MEHARATLDERQARLGEGARPAGLALAALGLVLLALAAYLGWGDDRGRRFLFSYLYHYAFFLSIALGGLFFVALQHASRAGWSVTSRRLAELLAATMPWLAMLFLPILLTVNWGNPALYPWLDPVWFEHHHGLVEKTRYLNASFFTVRALVYFFVWGWLGRYFFARSLRQDETAAAALSLKMERMGVAAIILFALTVTFASFDWLKSLDPAWFSTIYGVYYFAGAAVGALAAVILLAAVLQGFGRIGAAINQEHYHDLGKLLFAFVVFWGYIAFSQYLLIWYANIPEETQWYWPRHEGAWGAVTIVLALGHLVVPFLGLMPRGIKRRRWTLGFWAVWLLAMHWLDLYWLVMPHYDARTPVWGLVDACNLLGMAAVFVGAVLWLAAGRSLVPLGDPRLNESLAFENA